VLYFAVWLAENIQRYRPFTVFHHST